MSRVLFTIQHTTHNVECKSKRARNADVSGLIHSFCPSLPQPAVTFARHWHHLSAEKQVLGQFAVKAALLLMGKHKPRGIYTQGNDQAGDYVVVTNAERIVVTGKKAKQKLYYSHSGRPGSLKTETFEQRLERQPEEVSIGSPVKIFVSCECKECSTVTLYPLFSPTSQIIRHAVSGMLPKNRLRDRRLERLKVFAGSDNPYAANISRRYDVPADKASPSILSILRKKATNA